jgi:hypothetical protein
MGRKAHPPHSQQARRETGALFLFAGSFGSKRAHEKTAQKSLRR